MASLLAQLADAFEEQAEYYEQLLALSEEKKETVIKNEIDSLQKITDLENILISKNSRADKNREQLMSDLASVYGFAREQLSVEKLLSITTDEPESARIRAAAAGIRKTAEELGAINKQNRTLIENSLDYINFSVNLIKGAMQNEPTFYSASGDEIDNGRGFFDAKQ